MRNYKLLPVWLVLAASFIQCGLPSKPDFTTSHKVEAPILFNKTFQFLGGGEGETEALLDTTKADFDSLFVVSQTGDDAGLITLSKEETFDFGDLNDAIPTIDVEGTSFNTEVGEIKIASFGSSDGNLGEASFADLTGQAGFFQQGDQVPPQVISPEVTVNLDTDFFVSATFKSGSLDIVLENNLGFNLQNINMTLVSDPDTTVNGDEIDVVSDGTGEMIDGTSATVSLAFSDGQRLANPQVRISITWESPITDPQTFQRSPESIVVSSLEGNNLVASQVMAAVESQDFSSSNVANFDDAEFVFNSPDHYVELASGTIEIDAMVNGLDLTIDSLIISFPGIRRAPYGEGDSLRVRYLVENGVDGRILRSSTTDPKTRDLTGYRIFATNNQIAYNIYAVTENTQDSPKSDQTRVINETQAISSSVAINNLSIASAVGIIKKQTVLLGDDDPVNGDDVIDIYNDTETSITEIDGLEDLSSEISGIEFSGATLSISYASNIEVPTTIYAAILGLDGEGEEVFLVGKPGTDKEVQATDPIDGILSNGTALPASNMIKFNVEPVNGFGLVTFDEDNSTVNEFLNNLPNEIRFIGKAVINEDEGEATIATPLEFDPTMLVDLPIYFKADGASYSTTEEVTAFEDFPTEEDDLSITVGELIIGYKNGFPFGVTIELDFLNELGGSEVSVPRAGDDPLVMEAGEINSITRFVEAEKEGQLIISMDYDQLKDLYKADSLAVTATLNTFNNEAVKVRDKDAITINLSGNFTIENKISNN